MTEICPYAKPITNLSKVKGCEVTHDSLYLPNGNFKLHYRACSNYKKHFEDCPYYQKAQAYERKLLEEAKQVAAD